MNQYDNSYAPCAAHFALPKIGSDGQQLANMCWEMVRVDASHRLTTEGVNRALDDKGILREEETLGAVSFRLEDPFFGRWLREVQGGL